MVGIPGTVVKDKQGLPDPRPPKKWLLNPPAAGHCLDFPESHSVEAGPGQYTLRTACPAPGV